MHRWMESRHTLTIIRLMKWLSFAAKRLRYLILSRTTCKLSSKPILSISSFCSWSSTCWSLSPSQCSLSADSKQKSPNPYKNWPSRSRTPRTLVKMQVLTIKISNSSKKTGSKNKDKKSIETIRRRQLQLERWITKDRVSIALLWWKEILHL